VKTEINLRLMFKKNYWIATSILFFSAFSTNAFANYSCDGTVSYLGVANDGAVTVKLSNSTLHTICNIVIQGNYAIHPTVCKGVYGTLLAAKTSKTIVKLYYTDNGYNCATIPNWGIVPQTYFLEVPDQ
jgi:hypothetical protein